MKIQRFEDLECWKEARKLVNMVYSIINSNPKFKKDRRLSDQASSSAVSTMSNIAEGFSRRSNKEFVQLLFISKSSGSEVQSIFYVALDQKYISKDDCERVYTQADKVSQLDSGLITYLFSQIKKHKKPK